MGEESGGAVTCVRRLGTAALCNKVVKGTEETSRARGCWGSFLPISHCASSDAQWNRTHSVSPPRTATSGRSRAMSVERIIAELWGEKKLVYKDALPSSFLLHLSPRCRGRHWITVCVSTENLRESFYTAPRAAPSGRCLRYNDAKTRTIDTTELQYKR